MIVANFCASLDHSANSRFTYLAEHLYQQNEVELVVSDFSHGNRKARNLDITKYPYKITMLHEPGYKKNISVQRFLSHRVWGKNVAKYIKNRKKPDIVYCAMPSLTVAAKVGKYCKENNIKFVIDIQDLWPESFLMAFNVPILSTVAMLPFKKVADTGYRCADEICGVSETSVKRARRVNNQARIHPVFLGTDCAFFDQNTREHAVTRNNDGEIWIAYCGSLSDSYDIPCLIDAVRILNRSNVKLFIMGDGYKKDAFMAYAKEKNVNAVFTGRLTYEKMCGMLCACDMTVNPITMGSAASIINKHADYAASGLPVINMQESSEYRKLVEDYEMGINCPNGCAEKVAEAMAMLIDHPDRRRTMGNNARKCAEEKFEREFTYKELYDCILEK